MALVVQRMQLAPLSARQQWQSPSGVQKPTAGEHRFRVAKLVQSLLERQLPPEPELEPELEEEEEGSEPTPLAMTTAAAANPNPPAM